MTAASPVVASNEIRFEANWQNVADQPLRAGQQVRIVYDPARVANAEILKAWVHVDGVALNMGQAFWPTRDASGAFTFDLTIPANATDVLTISFEGSSFARPSAERPSSGRPAATLTPSYPDNDYERGFRFPIIVD
jgi:hypothetical protein